MAAPKAASPCEEVRPEFHPAAGEELTSAVQRCEEQVPGLGADLIAAVKPALPPQLEYNRHLQSHSRQHPGATCAEMLAAWREMRARPVR